jgi:hypothetical protein
MRPHLLIPVLVLAAALAACRITTPDFDLADDDAALPDAEAPDAEPPEFCSDGETNHGETDLDCGGPCPPCDVGGACLIDADCTTTHCQPEYGKCVDCYLDAHCDEDEYCVANEPIWDCYPKAAVGVGCVRDGQCLSGHCVGLDGTSVCCDRDCSAECDSCFAVETGGDDGYCLPADLLCPGDHRCDASGACVPE